MPRITTSETTKAVIAELERLAKINRRSAPMQALASIENELARNRLWEREAKQAVAKDVK